MEDPAVMPQPVSAHAAHASRQSRPSGCGRCCPTLVVALGRAAVTGSNHDSDSLGGRLLPEAAIELVPSRAKGGLAIAITGTQDGRQVVIDGIFDRQIEARRAVCGGR